MHQFGLQSNKREKGVVHNFYIFTFFYSSSSSSPNIFLKVEHKIFLVNLKKTKETSQFLTKPVTNPQIVACVYTASL